MRPVPAAAAMAASLSIAACAFLAAQPDPPELVPKAALALVERDIPTYGHVTRRWLEGGAPGANYSARPIVGVPWSIVFTTRPTPPYPDLPMRLIASLAPPGAEEPLSQTIYPGQIPQLTQQGGELWLDITWPPQWAGLRLWLQAVVSDPRSLSGELLSPVVELTIGEA